MRIKLPVFLLFIPAISLLFSTDWMDESRDYIESKQYVSLFELVSTQYEKNPSADLLLMKTDTALQYYSKTMTYQMFSFKNLETGESLLDTRLEEGSFTSFFYDLPAGLKTGMTRWPNRGDLDYKLAQVLEEGSRLFGSEWSWFTERKEQEKLLFSAWEKNYRSTGLIRDLAGVVTDRGDWERGSTLYKMLLAREETRKNRYRYTICLVKSEQYARAEEALTPLLESAASDAERLPLFRLHAYIAENREQWDSAHSRYLNIEQIIPGDPDTLGNIIRTSLMGENESQAGRESVQFLAQDPESPGRMQMIRELYKVSDQTDWLKNLWPGLLSAFKENPQARANILFHKGVSLLEEQQQTEALACLNEAETIFSAGGEEANQEAIDEIRRLKRENPVR